ncbi:MAG: TIGR00153 family protein [Acidobacteria bacterium]|nr:TIGR00153 family protein [Acidobacteriota bacterium]MCB9398698.1 TIGR00153 family protein [Acidobacteriota bacterium]
MASMSPFASLFGRSPFKALQEHMRAVITCVDLINPVFEALASGQQAEIERLKVEVDRWEGDADLIKNQLREHLPRGLFLPVDRRDLLEVLSMQDSMADVAQDIVELLVERPMELPDAMKAPLLNLVGRCIEVCHFAQKIIEELDELLEMGFKGKERAQVEEMVDQLNRMESDTDRLEVELCRTLFRHEDEMKPVSVMFWHQLIQWIGDLADYADKTGNRLRLLIAR